MRNADIAKKKIDKIAKKIGNRKIYFVALSRMLNKEFKSLRVKFIFQRSKADIDNFVVITGYYNKPEIDYLDYRYEICIARNPEYAYIKPRKTFFEELYLVMVHEFQHGKQHRARNFRKRRPVDDSFSYSQRSVQNQVRYLVDYDEIDAHAMEAAAALNLGKGYNYSAIRKYRKYVKPHVFKHWKTFMKKVYRYSYGN